MNNIEPLIIKLPSHYRYHDFLDFHKRDQQMLAEQVQDNTLSKGIVWEGRAVLLKIQFKKNHACAEVFIDGDNYNNAKNEHAEFQLLIMRMLGLKQNIDEFEQKFKAHPGIELLITMNPGLRVAVAATPFEALTWAITGQQISVTAAISIRRKFIQLAGMQHSSGLWCYPDEHIACKLTAEELRQLGFSHTKAKTIIALSDYLKNRNNPLNNICIDNNEAENLSAELLAIPGIGPWTINYALLRGFGWLDGSLHGDVAVRRSLQKLLGTSEKISEKEAQVWLAEFSPWRALVAAHLWAM